MLRVIFYFILMLAYSFASNAAEVDHFTKYDERLEDSAEYINREANEAVDKVLFHVNQQGGIACGAEEEIYDALKEQFSNHVFGDFTKKLINEFDINRKETQLEHSVYKNWSVFNGLLMGTSAGFKRQLVISDIVRVGEVEVGLDKFEHMFGQGFLYFKTNYLKGKGAYKAAKSGFAKERRILGGSLITNGIFSYGDLAANFNGMRFWNHFLQKRDDILGAQYNVGPILKCEKNKWSRIGAIDFRNYMDDSMNESINCSKYSTRSGVKKIKNQLKSMDMWCPMDRSRLEVVKAKYGKYAEWMINEKGIDRSRPNLDAKIKDKLKLK